MIRNALFFVPFALFTSCAAANVNLTNGAEQVRVVKGDPPPDFREVGPIEVAHGSGCGGFGEKGSYEGRTTFSRTGRCSSARTTSNS